MKIAPSRASRGLSERLELPAKQSFLSALARRLQLSRAAFPGSLREQPSMGRDPFRLGSDQGADGGFAHFAKNSYCSATDRISLYQPGR